MSEKEGYSMKQTVELTGLSKDTLRYYEQIGVLGPVARDRNRYRHYSQAEIDWLKIVKLLRTTGIGINEFVGRQQAGTRERREYLERYQKQIRQNIEELERFQEVLSEKVMFLKNKEKSEKRS